MFKGFLKTLTRKISQYKKIRFEQLLRNKGIKLGENIFWGDIASIDIDLTRPSLIEIGNNVRINSGTTLLTHDFATFVFMNKYGKFFNSSGKIKIGDNVYIGRNCTILKGVTIGKNCIIGINSLITKSIPPNSVAVGCPANVICSLEEYLINREKKRIDEALEYAHSIYAQFKRKPRVEEFWEEFPLFSTYEECLLLSKKNEKFELTFKYLEKDHVPVFNDFSEFLENSLKKGINGK